MEPRSQQALLACRSPSSWLLSPPSLFISNSDRFILTVFSATWSHRSLKYKVLTQPTGTWRVYQGHPSGQTPFLACPQHAAPTLLLCALELSSAAPHCGTSGSFPSSRPQSLSWPLYENLLPSILPPRPCLFPAGHVGTTWRNYPFCVCLLV